jgi:transcriptional regulator with PAS, ATPase and Fis domain
VAVNCAAIPENLWEAELFGYKKGAFTDAKIDKEGLFMEATGGTLFLDEIGDMPLSIQPKILRAIQEREIRPLGSIVTAKVDARIIAATNQNLVQKIEIKHFREDLFYRLNAMQIELPPLSARTEDIPLLVDHFLQKCSRKNGDFPKTVSPQALRRLIDYSWPGNIRELQNVLERAVLLSGAQIKPEDLSFYTSDDYSQANTKALDLLPLEAVEKEHILKVLEATGGNRTETALILGIGRKTLYNKLNKYGM